MNIIYFITVCIISLYFIYKVCDTIKAFKYKYTDLIGLFDYFLSKTYDIVYESDLITYLGSGDSKIPPKERETIERNFIKQCILYMGRKNYKLLIDFYGSEESLITNMLRYIRKRINDDGLSKIINNVQNQQ